LVAAAKKAVPLAHKVVGGASVVVGVVAHCYEIKDLYDVNTHKFLINDARLWMKNAKSLMIIGSDLLRITAEFRINGHKVIFTCSL
jgi:hypothetical protein